MEGREMYVKSFDGDKDKEALDKFARCLAHTAALSPTRRAGLEEIEVLASATQIGRSGTRKHFIFEAQFDKGIKRKDDQITVNRVVYSNHYDHEHEDGEHDTEEYVEGMLNELKERVRKVHPIIKMRIVDGRLIVDSYIKRFH